MMRSPRLAPAALLLPLLLAGCYTVMNPPPGPGLRAGANGYPREAPGAENPAVFPAAVAGFTKVSVTLYAPGLADYSVGYNDFSPGSPGVATLYFYQPSAEHPAGPLPAQFAQARGEVLASHPGVRVVDEYATQLTKHGRSYPALGASFTYTEPFGGQVLPLYSRLLVVALPGGGGTFKWRFTTPAPFAGVAGRRGEQLLDAIDWTATDALAST